MHHIMRCVNIEDYKILLKGDSWKHDVLPCSKDAIQLLENNKSVVTWLVPKEKAGAPQTCLTHIPVIFFKGRYWALSLRMSKCIYHHIRLRKGFKNIQTVH